jgi:glycosyltransferase involved in cell wall biosynthesis
MRLHVFAIPHTITNEDYVSCAFTQKVLKFCKMMFLRGHTVYHYGHDKSDVICSDHISVTNNSILEEAYGIYNWKKDFFKHSGDDLAHRTFVKNAKDALRDRVKKNDIACIFWGFVHYEICASFKDDLIIVEAGMGCPNKPAAEFAVFESYALLHEMVGRHERYPRFYDAVIPNYFDKKDFIYNPYPKNYMLYLGRIIDCKGIRIAIDATEKAGKTLYIAGQGDLASFLNNTIPSHVIDIGFADIKARKELMSNAQALIAPTHYNEPFGGVTVEAMLCGTPIITTDWGAFAENNIHGITGYRCRTMEQFVWACKNIHLLSRLDCHKWASSNFTFDKVGAMYDEYFNSLLQVHNGQGGFYAENNSRQELDWLKKTI